MLSELKDDKQAAMSLQGFCIYEDVESRECVLYLDTSSLVDQKIVDCRVLARLTGVVNLPCT